MAALQHIGTRALTFAIAVLIERLVPAIAVGMVAAAHELHHDSAARESERRRA